MSLAESALLGLLQGLTEFLPVSSSGHLVLAQALLGVKQPGVSFEVILHLGTLLSVLVYFRRRVWSMVRAVFVPGDRERRTIVFLVVGTVPAALAGLLLKDLFESAFSSPRLTAVMLLVTGLVLLSSRFAPVSRRGVTLGGALVMGLGQALAIMPGISRSGTTIVSGIWARIDPSEAAEFSFLLALPAIAGAAVLEIDTLAALQADQALAYLAGAVLAFLSGLVAVYVVMKAVRTGRFDYFAYYCFAAGLAGLYLFR